MLDSFRLRLTFFFGGLTLIMGLGLALYVNQVASSNLTQASGEALRNLGRSAAMLLGRTLHEREREVTLLSKSPTLTSGDLVGPVLQKRIDQLKASYPDYAWIGVVDPQGKVISSSDGLLRGQNVAQRPWFQAGLKGVYVGDVHKAVMLAKLLHAGSSDEGPLRFVDFAAPIYDGSGALRGVVATHVHWSWVGGILTTVLGDGAPAQGVEAMILSREGEWLHPFEHIGALKVPANLPTDGQFGVVEWADGARYLTSRTLVQAGVVNELGWQIILRQPVTEALEPVDRMQRNLLIASGLAVVVCALLVHRLAGGFSRPVEQLAEAAHVIERGNDTHAFEVGSPLREIRNLTASLRGMMETLAAQRWALQESNVNLERQVEARTLELQQANEALECLARQDALTGLHNRRAADERLQDEFLRWRRCGVTYAVLLMDIDFFKRINDTYGHEEGDRVLQQVAGLLRRQVRRTDFLARFGGEEFLAILPGTDQAGAMMMAEKLRAQIEASSLAPVGGVTLSIGLALAETGDDNRETAVRRADDALYRAKGAGRNQVAA